MVAPAARGSKQSFRAVKETSFGVTPTTPALKEIVANTFNKDVAISLIRSDQIRSHPFVDRLMQGAQVNDLQVTWELQDDNHDLLLEVLTGQAWTSNTTKAVDVLASMSVESEHTDLVLYDQFQGVCIKQAQFNFPAATDAKVTVQADMMALDGQLDLSTPYGGETITAATSPDPYVFHEATLKVDGVDKIVTAASFTVARQIDPLYVLGSRSPHDYIPAAVTITGQVTMPLYDNAESTRLINFTDGALVITCAQTATPNSRVFTLPKVNYAKMGRQIQGRGVILQVIDFEAKYDLTSGTAFQIDRT